MTLQVPPRGIRLEVGSVILRPPRLEDAASLVDAVRRSLTELRPFMPWATQDYDLASAQAWIEGEFGDFCRFLLVDDDGSIAGSCGLNQLDEANRRANLGYWVRSDLSGRGLATAATVEVAAHGLNTIGLHRLEIIMSTENSASRRVAERAGAGYEGLARGRILLHGVHHDAHCYSLIADDLRDRSPTYL